MSSQSNLYNTQQLIIGACLIETNAFLKINGILKPDYFISYYAKIYKAMQALDELHIPIHIINVNNYLSKGKSLDFNIESFVNLASISNIVSSTANLVDDSLILIQQYWEARALEAIPNTITLTNLELAQDLDELIDEINSPDCNILDSLTMATKQIQLHHPKYYHVYKNLLEVERQMLLDISQIEDILSQRG